MIDPRYEKQSEPKVKATLCLNCGLFETEDGIRDYFVDYRTRERFEVTEQECKNCKNELK